VWFSWLSSFPEVHFIHSHLSGCMFSLRILILSDFIMAEKRVGQGTKMIDQKEGNPPPPPGHLNDVVAACS